MFESPKMKGVPFVSQNNEFKWKLASNPKGTAFEFLSYINSYASILRWIAYLALKIISSAWSIDMRSKNQISALLAVFAFAARPNNNDNANGNTTNGGIRGGRDADTMNASTIPKPGVVPRYSISSSS